MSETGFRYIVESAARAAGRRVAQRRPRRAASLERLENRQLLATLDLANQAQTYATLPDTTVTMTGRSELRITAAATPITNSLINLNSQDSWLFLTGIKPSVVNSTYLSQVRVNGVSAVNGTNVRVVQYETGTVVIPHTPGFQPLTTYLGPNFTGTSRSFGQNTIYNTSGELVEQFNNISSFKLRRGYMATVATQTNGAGDSKVYIAQDNDLDVSLLSSNFDNAIQFIRVLPWRWVAKKGASDLSATTLNAQWFYNWNNSSSSSLDAEYVPIRQQLYWPGLPGETQTGVTHLLGFNEPNNPVEDAYTSLGNGSIENALNYWPNMESTGLRIGSPAVTDGGKSWLYSFMDQAIARGLRVDFIAIHNYQAGHTATSLYNWLKDIYDRYHLPIWITEFNNGANWTSGTDPTFAQNASWLASITDMFDNTPWIERYSVYSAVEEVRQMVYNAGGLTPAGQVYYDNASPASYMQEAVGVEDTGGRAVARLPMNGNALDVSGFGNNGEAQGGLSYVAGHSGQALQFDGTSGAVRLTETVGQADALTFAAWVNWDGGANWQRIFDFGNDTNQYAYLSPSNGSAMRFAIKNGGTEYTVSTTTLPVGTWTHVAVTLGATTAKLYVNGALVATNASVPIKPGDFDGVVNYLGKSKFAADPAFKGKLDDVLITDYVLTGTQIAALMNDTAPAFTSASLTRGPALRGVNFSGTIAGTATDSDVGDTIAYGKVHGPAWLNVAADGTLSGAPGTSDSGPQEFVVSATDASGEVTYAVLTVEIGDTYWRGDVSNNWTANSAGNTNWASNSAGTTDLGSLPNASSDLVFGSAGAANLPTTILGANQSVRTIRVNAAAGLAITGSNHLTLGSGGLVTESGAGATSVSTTGQLVLGATQTWTLDSTNAVTIGSVISGINSLTKTGVGTLIFTANNTYTGSTTIAQGQLKLGNASAAGSVVGNIVNLGELVVDRTSGITLAGLISGSGIFTKNNSAILTLSGVNSFSGATTINAGGIYAISNNALGSGIVSIGPGGNATTARLMLGGNVTLPNAITLAMRTNASAAVQNINGTNALSGTITLDVGGSIAIFQSDAGLLKLGAITAGTSATGSRLITLTGAGSGLINGVVSNGAGTVGLTKQGGGTWTLNAVNTYTGATTVSVGTLALSAADRIADASGLVLSGGTFATGGFNETLGTLTLSANSAINVGSGASTLRFGGVGTFTAGTTLNITGYTSGVDHVYVGTTAVLTAAQLAQIKFNGTSAQQLASGEVVPLTSAAPTVATPASGPGTFSGTSATFSVLGADDGGEANVTYSWSVLSKPANALDPTFSLNDTNSSRTSVVTFSDAGNYTFRVTIQDGSGLTATSNVSVTVNQVFTGIAAASPSVAGGTSVVVRGADQFGDAMTLSGAAWSTSAGSITQSGVFTAPVSGATIATVNAVVGATTYTTNVAILAGRAWYKADNAGATLIDSSGSNNDAALGGAYGYVAGRSGTALSLTGGAATLPAGIVSGLSDFTFSAWVYLTANSSWSRIFDFGSSTTSNMFLTTNAGGNNNLRFAITTSGGGGEQRIDGTALSLNTWAHVAVTLVGDVGTLYVNGVAVGTNHNMTLRPASLGNTTNNYLGDSQYTADPALSGRLDDVRILNVGLNAAGVFALRDAWQAPAVVNGGAFASPDVVLNATTTDLSVLGTSAPGEATLTYRWEVLGTPPAPVTFSANGTNAAKNTTATFTADGTYQFRVTITNTLGASVTSTVSVPVTLPVPLATVTAATEQFDVGSHTLRFTFDRDVGSQDWNNLVEVKSVGGAAVAPTAITYDAPTQTLTVTLPAVLANGDYTATLKQGTYLAADFVKAFFVLGGDADRNRTVDFSDLLIIAQNYGLSGKTYLEGDFSGDGVVDFSDLLTLAQNYGTSMVKVVVTSVVTPASAAASTSTRRKSNAASTLV